MKILVLAVLIMIVSCQQNDNFHNDHLFDPPTEVKVSDLKDAGYNYVDEWSWYNKVDGDTAFIYMTHFDTDPVFSRIVDIGNWKVRDSIGIRNFVESRGGTMVTPMFNDSIANRFFVQGKSSGQFFRCSLTSNHLTIESHYPDTRDNLRSIYRKPTADGFTVEFENGGRSYNTSSR
jgi:hypothetical protein